MEENENLKVELVRKDNGKFDTVDVTYNSQTGEIRVFLEGQEIDMRELMRTYEDLNPIKDVVDKTKEEQKRDDNSRQREKISYHKLREEKTEEDKIEEENDDGKKKDEKKTTVSKALLEPTKEEKQRPSHVIERINPDKAKMDYWKTLKQAFRLPSEVDTLAFAYPVSSKDKVDYANITVYMLDKNGYIINDLKIDDYFEFDSSTGNNPIKDETVRHEEDDHKGEVQLDNNNTMIRLKAKKNNNTYISLEEKNSVGDCNDINGGRKIVGGTQNIEKQFETDRVRVWSSEREEIVKSNAGLYNMNEIFDEAKKHKEHGDKNYIDTANADGDKKTIEICNDEVIPGTNTTWRQFANICGYRGDDAIEKAQKEFINYKKDYPDTDNREVIEEIQEEIENEVPGRNRR